MANVLNGRIWSIDTVDADVIDAKACKVKSVRWVAGATSAAGEALIFRDPVLNTILWETTASGANYDEESLIETWWSNGFEVPTIDNGTAYLTLE